MRISQDGNAAFATLPYVVTFVHFRIRKSGFGKTKREKNTFLLLNPALSPVTPSVEAKIERVFGSEAQTEYRGVPCEQVRARDDADVANCAKNSTER